MEFVNIIVGVVGSLFLVGGAFVAYLVLRMKVENEKSNKELRAELVFQGENTKKELSDQISKMREELMGDIKERVQRTENNFIWVRDQLKDFETKEEVTRLRDRQHDFANELSKVSIFIEQSKSTHERLARTEERVRDLERRP